MDERPAAKDGFDFTGHMRRLCHDLVTRLPELAHIDLSRVAISFCQTRKQVQWGIQATLTPMRFEGGSLFQTTRGRRYTVQRVYDRDGREMLYVLSFYLPRFLHRPFHDRLTTVIHELWHISPEFNGDLRRHEGRCYAHSSSKHAYDAAMAVFAQRWLSLSPPLDVQEILRLNFRQLLNRYGRIYGARVPRPKLLPVSSE